MKPGTLHVGLLPIALRDVFTVYAQPFDDFERGRRWYLRWTRKGTRCWAILDDADLVYARQALRSGTLVKLTDPWDLRASEEHRTMMEKLSA